MWGVNWGLLAACVVGASFVGVAVFHAVAGYFHYRYYVRRRDDADTWKLQPGRYLTPAQQRLAVRMSTCNLALNGALTGLLVYGVASETVATPIYTDVGDYGWAYTLSMTVVLFALTEYITYWVHRLLHTKFFFRRLHRHHHRFVATTPYVTAALHPAEVLLVQVLTFAPLFLIPFHAVSAVVVFLYTLIYNIVNHTGVKGASILPWQPPVRFHDDHHAHVHVNFGQHVMIWDRLHGTLRRQNRRYGADVFGGRGLPERDDAGHRSPLVKY